MEEVRPTTKIELNKSRRIKQMPLCCSRALSEVPLRFYIDTATINRRVEVSFLLGL